MNRNLFKPARKLPLYRVRDSHTIPPVNSRNLVPVYALNPWNDKGFTQSPVIGTFCYTSHAPQGPEAQNSRQKRTWLIDAE